MKKKIKIYNSSAGTGKTNKLIIIYILYLFKNKKNINFFSKLLIITFTKKTYLEIFNKIIDYLKILSNKKKYKFFFLSKIIKKKFLYSYKEIYLLSNKILKNILFFFEKFSILTIDKFIFKYNYFKKENFFNYYNFYLIIDTIINSTINNILYKTFYEKKKKKKFIKKYIYKNINNGFFNIKYNLYKKIKLFINNKNLFFLYKKKNIKKKIIKIKNKIIYNKKKIKFFLKKKKKKFFNFLKKKKIKKKSFFYNDIINIFNKKINISLFKKIYFYNFFFNKRLINNFKKKKYFSKKIDNNQKKKILKNEIIIKRFLFNYKNIIKKISLKYILYDFFLKNYIYIYFLYKIFKKIKKISLINYIKKKKKKIYKYEIFNNIYKVYLIDEFQDISIYQWNKIKIFLKNILSENGKIYFFGDIKQSIYRWRNVDSTNLLNKINNLYNKNYIKNFFLRKNFRSYYYIIQFNNNLFYYITNFILNKKYKKFYKNTVIQLTNNKNNGYVEINFYKKKIKKIINIIKKILNNGYNCKDIIILVRKNKDINYLIKKLNFKKKILFTNKNLLLYNNIYIKILIEFFKLFFYKKKKYYINFIILIFNLNNFKKKIKKKINYFFKKILNFKNKLKNFLKILKKFNLYINYKKLFKLNIYDFFEYIINKLKFNKFKFIFIFLNIIYNFYIKKYNNFNNFIYFWNKNKKKYFIKNKNNINITTIHKAKGLEYKIVIIFIKNWNILYNNKNFNYIKDINFFLNILKYKNYKNKINYYFNNNQIDNFNLLYVASTRAIKKLFFFIKKKKKKNNIYYI
ncbi:MAG: UvrD-helicase domain-containing protein [Candidatus Shikimatogenerans bostrichidophilus]|nr:MAG: UvrD-helicase domain-containing protein [Candidatus Shikimatogenerans bostrichidophilus]